MMTWRELNDAYACGYGYGFDYDCIEANEDIYILHATMKCEA